MIITGDYHHTALATACEVGMISPKANIIVIDTAHPAPIVSSPPVTPQDGSPATSARGSLDGGRSSHSHDSRAATSAQALYNGGRSNHSHASSGATSACNSLDGGRSRRHSTDLADLVQPFTALPETPRPNRFRVPPGHIMSFPRSTSQHSHRQTSKARPGYSVSFAYRPSASPLQSPVQSFVQSPVQSPLHSVPHSHRSSLEELPAQWHPHRHSLEAAAQQRRSLEQCKPPMATAPAQPAPSPNQSTQAVNAVQPVNTAQPVTAAHPVTAAQLQSSSELCLHQTAALQLGECYTDTSPRESAGEQSQMPTMSVHASSSLYQSSALSPAEPIQMHAPHHGPAPLPDTTIHSPGPPLPPSLSKRRPPTLTLPLPTTPLQSVRQLLTPLNLSSSTGPLLPQAPTPRPSSSADFALPQPLTLQPPASPRTAGLGSLRFVVGIGSRTLQPIQALTALAEGRAQCAVTGAAFQHLMQQPDLAPLEAVLRTAVVLARMQPHQKGQAVELLTVKGVHQMYLGTPRHIQVPFFSIRTVCCDYPQGGI